jgi:hypothetical protein
MESKAAKELPSLVPFFSLVFANILINLVSRHRRASPPASRHSGATQVMVSIHLTLSKVLFVFFFKCLELRSNCVTRTTNVLKVIVLNRTDRHKEKSVPEMFRSGTLQKPSFIWAPYLSESKRKNSDDPTTTTTPPPRHRENYG